MKNLAEQKRLEKIFASNKGWYTIETDELSICMRCNHTGYEHAEHDKLIADKKTGEHEVFCPKCKSDVYFLTEETAP